MFIVVTRLRAQLSFTILKLSDAVRNIWNYSRKIEIVLNILNFLYIFFTEIDILI